MTRIFKNRSVLSSLYGVFFSVNFTAGPMFTVIICMLAMYRFLGFSELSYLERTLFTCTVLYVFIFSLLCASPFNSVLSKYMSDRIFLERFDDIRPCAYVGITASLVLAALLGIPFCLRLYIVGGIPARYIFMAFLCYLALSFVLAAMVFNSILKHYKKIMRYFTYGMLITFILSLIFRFVFRFSVTISMLSSLTIGFVMIAILEFANILRNFRKNSQNYMGVVHYFKMYWVLIAANFLYVLGLFAHNFVFWFHPWQLKVAQSYICNEPYDMASFAAMLTNISGTVLFVMQVEMHFHQKYADFMSSVIGGSLNSIEKAKNRMFQSLATQWLSLGSRQFIISVVLFMIAYLALPMLGFSGPVADIYPMLAVSYFISFIMYSGLLFLYYFNDYTGALVSTAVYASVSLVGSIFSSRLPVMWYGSGFGLAALCSFTIIFSRLIYIEKNIDYNVFCTGSILKKGEGNMPDPVVYRNRLFDRV